MKTIKSVEVKYHSQSVGTLAIKDRHIIAFEYSKDWLADGFSISPYSLPLRPGVFIPKYDPFQGVFGVFSDSLPDEWGRLLVDRLLAKKQINPLTISQLHRLAIVGGSGMGALTYEPEVDLETKEGQTLNLDKIAEECERILKTEYVEDLDLLFHLGGSSGGSRSKILTRIDGEDWIIKFPSAYDGPDIGKKEYEYSLCAKECGIEVEETRLFSSSTSSGYFGTRRFDRDHTNNTINTRKHMITVSGLLETSHRIPNLDYHHLMRLTLDLTKDFKEVEQMYRLMCFNVFSHNRDDHSKNFSYIYDDKHSKWRLAPAYDLTYSNSIGGEHATTVDGNGIDPGFKELLAVGEKIGINKKKLIEIAEFVEDKCKILSKDSR